jgi:hypothetical protein
MNQENKINILIKEDYMKAANRRLSRNAKDQNVSECAWSQK